MQLGLSQALQQLSKLKNKSGESIYWLAYIVEKSIFMENYEVLDTFLVKSK